MSKTTSQIGPPPSIAKRYITAFLGMWNDFRKPHGIKKIHDSEWSTCDYRLSDKRLMGHLRGEHYISIPKRDVCGVVFDIDAHEEAKTTEEKMHQQDVLDEKTSAILSIFAEWTGLVFTTPRGRHIWFLRSPGMILLPEGRVQRYVEFMLDSSGFIDHYGEIEFAPQKKGLIRLPLGHDCLMLDTFSLDPVAPTTRKCLYKFNEIIKNEQMDWVRVPAYFAHYKPIKKRGRTRRKRIDENKVFNQDVKFILENGLTEGSQRNDVLRRLSWYYQATEGLERDETKRVLRDWIDVNHNGQSDDYNKSPELVYKHIDRIVEGFDEGKISTSNKSGLSVKVGEIALPDTIVSQTTQTDQAFLKELIAYTKNRGELKRKWVYVEIPSQTLSGWNRSYRRILGKLKKLKLVKDGKNYTTNGRCKTYLLSQTLIDESPLKETP